MLRLTKALLAFEGGFLSIESGEATAVMRAEGEWHGRAMFGASVLRALAELPPKEDRVEIRVDDDKIHFGTLSVNCEWQTTSQSFIRGLIQPSLLDLLVLDRTMSRAEVAATPLGQDIQCAQAQLERKIKNAAKHLAELEISEDLIRELVEERIGSRLNPEGGA